MIKSITIILCMLTGYIVHGQIMNEYFEQDVSEIDASLIPVKRGNLFGFVDRQNQTIITPDYESVSMFNKNGYAIASKFGLFGLIDKNGKEVLPFIAKDKSLKNSGNLARNYKADDRSNFSNVYYNYNSKSKKLHFFKSEKGKLRTSEVYFGDQSPLDSRIETVAKNRDSYIGFYQSVSRVLDEKGFVFFIDTNFAEIHKERFYDGQQLESDRFVVYGKNEVARVIDENGKELASGFYSVKTLGKDGYYLAESNARVNYRRSYGLMGRSGKLILDTIYSSITYLNEDNFALGVDNKYGAWNLKGEELVPKEYSRVRSFGKDQFITSKNQQWHIHNSKGQIVNGPFDKIYSYDSNKYAYAIKGDTVSFFNKEGTTLFTKIGDYSMPSNVGEVLVFSSNKKYGLFTSEGKVLLDPIYDQITKTDIDPILVVKKGNDMGLYDWNGKWLEPLGKYHIFYLPISVNRSEPSLKLTGTDKELFYEGVFDNPTIKKIEKKRSSFRIPTERDRENNTVTATFPNGEKVTYPDDRTLVPQYNDGYICFEKKENRRKTLVNKELKAIFPEGYYYNNIITVNGVKYYQVFNEDKYNGLADAQGNWIFEPKKKQYISKKNEHITAVSLEPSNFKLYDSNFKKISEIFYKNVDAQSGIVYASEEGSPFLTMYNREDKLISKGKYTRLIEVDSNYINVEKSPNLELESCLIDHDGKEHVCLPYSSIKAIEGIDFYIVKDVNDYGVIRKDGSPFIDIKFKDMRYYPEIKAFQCMKGGNQYDLVNLENEIVLKDFAGWGNIQKLNGVGASLKGKNETIIFDDRGKIIITLSNDVGRLAAKNNLFDQGLLKFVNKSSVQFVDISSGMVYK